MSKRGSDKAKKIILSVLGESTIPLSAKDILFQIKARNLKGWGNTKWGTLRIGGFLRILRNMGIVEHIGSKDRYRWKIIDG